MKCPKLYGEECKCDGCHTFKELYDHRITLYIALCRVLKQESEWAYGEGASRPILYRNGNIWRSKRHSDGELCFGTGTQFVLGIRTDPMKQITYHIPIERWNETEFAQTFEVAPEWDKHTSDDVLQRLKNL